MFNINLRLINSIDKSLIKGLLSATSNISIIACRNTAVRIGFDPFIEHSIEMIALCTHSKDLHIQQKILNNNETLYIIDVCNENSIKYQHEPLKLSILDGPDAPKLWLVKTSYGIFAIGFQLYIGGKQTGDIISIEQKFFQTLIEDINLL
ncbi:unnamed protein product [Rotaria sp. Silwood2]|nr:unnamed protein product [Rotaria sp. Silwood2]CAF4145155.1 unnamed protein product [Rotaria sp. Silwood2]